MSKVYDMGYNHKEEMKRLLDKISNVTYSQYNIDKILEYSHILFAEGLSDSRILKYLTQLNIVSGWLDKEFDKVTKVDMLRIMANLKRSGDTL